MFLSQGSRSLRRGFDGVILLLPCWALASREVPPGFLKNFCPSSTCCLAVQSAYFKALYPGTGYGRSNRRVCGHRVCLILVCKVRKRWQVILAVMAFRCFCPGHCLAMMCKCWSGSQEGRPSAQSPSDPETGQDTLLSKASTSP